MLAYNDSEVLFCIATICAKLEISPDLECKQQRVVTHSAASAPFLQVVCTLRASHSVFSLQGAEVTLDFINFSQVIILFRQIQVNMLHHK